jgi:two-component system, chemotaxis family, CheB/CheR fusion protein
MRRGARRTGNGVGMASEKAISVVGIGASAGGLEAIEVLFRAMPADTRLGFVIVTHLARGQHSSLAEILQRHTVLPVKDAQDEEEIEPNHIYICPPNHILTIVENTIRLQERNSDLQRRPIDVFLSSLAEDSGESCVGILLSGGGTDGTLGMKAIKERGGLTLAQGRDGSAPAQSGMPNAAVAAGVVDLVLSVEEMAARLDQHARETQARPDAVVQDELEHEGEIRNAIYEILLKQVGHDFAGYKVKTFMRRVRRRMQVLQMTSLDHYLQRLREDPEEVTLLFRDLLIGVTNFFRDPGAFDALATMVIPSLFENKGAADSVRVWVPGCATGEEVYSIAILLREHMDTLRAAPKVQIFATDIDEQALSVARLGRYPAPLMEHVSPQRLKRFFVADDVTYQVSRDVRDLCMFSTHSIIRDPPFSRIDLVSCRNLLIYFGVAFQGQAIPVFHFSLRPRGYLFLGTSENVSQYGDLFAPVDKKHRIFQRRDNVTVSVQFPQFKAHRQSLRPSDLRGDAGAMVPNMRRALETTVLDRHAPAHVVVNREGEVLHYSPRTGKYLEAPAGSPNRQLLAMARRGLRLDLRTALREAVESHGPVERDNIAIELDDRVQLIKLSVEPFGENDGDPLYLVVFHDLGQPFNAADVQKTRGVTGETDTVDQLEGDLRDTKERLQATIEEYETALEELKSSNEELQSINEELQSTNEELETSKEELQSVNEELQTVNSELNAKIEEVDRVHADLRNVFESTQIATVFLDRDLVIRSFTPAVTLIFNLIATDRGRPLTDIVSHLDATGDLKRDIQLVLESGQKIERNVKRSDRSANYLMRVLPYRDRHDAIDGVLVTFIDVTKLIESEAHQRMLVEEFNHRVRNIFAVVSAFARQPRSGAPSGFINDLIGRIHSMDRAYALVSRAKPGAVDLRDILADGLSSAQGKSAARVTLEGIPVGFMPQAALALSLVIHELASNAQKHGALSAPKGSLNVRWALGNPHGKLVLNWEEKTGKKIKRPAAKGFGLELFDRELKSALGGTADFSYGAQGLTVKIVIPEEPRRWAVLPGPLDKS